MNLQPAALLQLIWLASPALPVGGFSYSEGLEAAVEAGIAATEPDVQRWLVDQLELGLARGDMAAAAAAFEAFGEQRFDRVSALNDWVHTTRESSELRQQTEQMGRSLAEWLRARLPADDAALLHLGALRPAPSWPIGFALAAQRSGADRQAAMLAFGFGWAENMVQAAVKAVPLGQSAGQRLLAALADRIPAAVERALALDESARQVFTPGLAILSARHEAQYSRLFRS